MKCFNLLFSPFVGIALMIAVGTAIKSEAVEQNIPSMIGIGIQGTADDNGPAEQAVLHGPAGMAYDQQGNLYFADYYNHRVCRVDGETGLLTTVAGTAQQGFSGDNGPAIEAQLNGPFDVELGSNHLYIADSLNHRIRVVNLDTGVIETLAGNGSMARMRQVGVAKSTALSYPKSISLAANHTLYVADRVDASIAAVHLKTGQIDAIELEIAGQESLKPSRQRRSSQYSAYAITSDRSGQLYVSDYDNNRISKINTATAKVSRFTTSKEIGGPMGLAVSKQGNLIVIESASESILTLDADTGMVLKEHRYGSLNGVKLESPIRPSHLAVAKNGRVHIARFLDNRIETLATLGKISEQNYNGISLAQLAQRVLGDLDGSLPKDYVDNPELELLGKTLFHDPRLSASKQLSCATCHDVRNRYGVDHKVLSHGHENRIGVFNTPTVFNAAFNQHFMFDGRAQSLQEQAKLVLLNFREMANESAEVLSDNIRAIGGYKPMFKAAFGEISSEPITIDTITDSLAAYQNTLITPSAFDSFLQGDRQALSAEAQRGLGVFFAKGCAGCHSGPTLGGSLLRTKNPILRIRRNIDNNLGQHMTLRVPQLRNIAKTQPYLHRGSASSIEQAIQLQLSLYSMHYYQQTRAPEFNATEMQSLLAFFDSLTGSIPEQQVSVPMLPAVNGSRAF